MTWTRFYLLSTAQKLGPLLALHYFIVPSILIFRVLLRTLISAAGVWNEPYARQVLALSSVFNTSWLATISQEPRGLWCVFAIYCAVLFIVVLGASGLRARKANELQLLPKSFALRGFFMVALLNLGGLPPFLGAYFKILLLSLICNTLRGLMARIYLLISTWFFYIYLSLGLTILLSEKNQSIKPTLNTHSWVALVIFRGLLPWAFYLLHLSVLHKKFWFSKIEPKLKNVTTFRTGLKLNKLSAFKAENA